MASPDDLKVLDKLEDVNYATLTEQEKDEFRSIDFSDAAIAEAAGKLPISVGGESMTVDALGKKIYDLAKDKTFTTHADVKKFLTENGYGEIDKTPITGKLQGATAAGIDFKFGIGTMTALKAKYRDSSSETSAEIEHANIHTLPSARIESDTKQVNLLSGRENLTTSDLEVLQQANKDGYITVNMERGNNIAYPKTAEYNDDKEIITITSSEGKADLILDATNLYRKDGESIIMDRNAFSTEFIAAMKRSMRTEAEKKISTLDTSYTSIENKFKKIDTSDITPGQIKEIMLHPQSDARERQKISNNITTLKSILSSISTIYTSSKDIPSTQEKDAFEKKVKGLETQVANALQKRQDVLSFLTIFEKDKKTRETYIKKFVNYNRSGSNHEAMINEGKTLISSLEAKTTELKKYDKERGGPETNYGHIAYQEAVRVMKNLKVAGKQVFTKQTILV